TDFDFLPPVTAPPPLLTLAARTLASHYRVALKDPLVEIPQILSFLSTDIPLPLSSLLLSPMLAVYLEENLQSMPVAMLNASREFRSHGHIWEAHLLLRSA